MTALIATEKSVHLFVVKVSLKIVKILYGKQDAICILMKIEHMKWEKNFLLATFLFISIFFISQQFSFSFILINIINFTLIAS